MQTLRNYVVFYAGHIKGRDIKEVFLDVVPHENATAHGYLLVVQINFKHMTCLEII
jgi:hypothetical protein